MLFIIPILIVMTIAAFWNYSFGDSSDAAVARLANPSKQMMSYHAAAARSCYANGTPCGAGALDKATIAAKLPTFQSVQPVYTSGRFGSFATSTHLITYYLGTGAGDREGRAQVLAGIMREAPSGSGSSIGYYDGVSIRPRGVIYQVSLPTGQGGGQTSGSVVPAVPVESTYGASIPVGAPMLATRLR